MRQKGDMTQAEDPKLLGAHRKKLSPRRPSAGKLTPL
jgi:hypothetical protein